MHRYCSLILRCQKELSEEETHRNSILRYPGKAGWRYSQECLSPRGRETDVEALTFTAPLLQRLTRPYSETAHPAPLIHRTVKQ